MLVTQSNGGQSDTATNRGWKKQPYTENPM